jgi:cation-transporting P-type ATPase C
MAKCQPSIERKLKTDDYDTTSKMAFQIAHSIPGRLRVRIPILKTEKQLSQSQEAYLLKVEGIEKVTSNHYCGSITIHYNTKSLKREDILTIIGETRIDDLKRITPPVSNRRKGFLAQPGSRLKWSTIAVTLTIFFSDTLFPMRILLYVLIILISIPIYQQAIDTIFNKKRIDLDALNAFAMTIGLMADDLVVTAIMAFLIYLADYMLMTLIASGKNRFVCMLMGDGY